MTRYVFEPEVTERVWLDIVGNSQDERWAVWRSMPHPERWRGPDRKRLLLVAHLLRQVADQFTNPVYLAAIEAGEKCADGLITEKEMWEARERAYEVFDTTPLPNKAEYDAANSAQRYIYSQDETAEMVVQAAGSRAARLAGGKGPQADNARHAVEKEMEALSRRLINEVHGNPFRPVAFDPAWCTSTAVALAKQMYESRDFCAMAILADALQDVGCDSDDVLGHCRDAKQVHVRGCWVVDLVLGKA
jgi:hypothetical protein